MLVKLGGSLLTEKKSQTPKIRENNIIKISEIISKINKKIGKQTIKEIRFI